MITTPPPKPNNFVSELHSVVWKSHAVRDDYSDSRFYISVQGMQVLIEIKS